MTVLEKIWAIITNIMLTIQVIADNIINLAFQPLFAVLDGIAKVMEIWTEEEEEEDDTMEFETEQPQYPTPTKVQGFHTNHEEETEINRIKEQLGQ